MKFNKDQYLKRLIDPYIERCLKSFSAISIEGPKWCGKTWTSLKHAKSVKYLDDENTKSQALLDLELILNEEYPELIDEWSIIPNIWDKIRRKCDEDNKKGKYILTCSTHINDNIKKNVFHSGAGRIVKINMSTMSLYESNDSDGVASLKEMYNGTQKNIKTKSHSIYEIANLIIRGGWPANLNVDEENISLLPKAYINSILDNDINDDKKRNKKKMLMLLRSLARNESTIVSDETILKDINDNESIIESRVTLDDYLNCLDRLNLFSYQEAYSSNYRSKSYVGKSSKRHFIDPSISCALLNLNKDKLLKDLKTFGFMFEALVERDLKVYIESIGGKLYHFRDNVTNLEVDSIIEFSDGEYAAIEIKLGYNQVEDAKKTLLKYYKSVIKKPKFMCIIVSNFFSVVKDKESGIYICPITSLRP